MSEINQIDVGKLFVLIGNENVRRIIKMMNVSEAVRYSEVSNCIDQKNLRQQGVTGYYLKKMAKLGLIRRDIELHRWYLTRAGLRIRKIIRNFEKYCTTYDMNDVNADGKVKIFAKVENRKPENVFKIIDMITKHKEERVI